MKSVAFYPFQIIEDGSYVNRMRKILEKHYIVLNYLLFKKHFLDIGIVDVIYLNWIESKLDTNDIELLNSAKEKGVRIIWVFHNKLPHEREILSNELDKMKYLVHLSDRIIIHSKDSCRYLANYNSDSLNKTFYIPHINYLNIYRDFNNRKDMDTKEKIVFGMLGNLRPYKNIEQMIEAFNILRAECSNIALIIAGEPLNNDYAKVISNKIKNLDGIVLIDQYIPSLEMKAYLNSIDVMVLPYNSDSGLNSGAMIMAFSYGKTVIISDIAMAMEYDDELIYRYKDNKETIVQSLLEEMYRVVSDGKEVLKEKGDKLMRLVEKDNSEVIVDGLLQELIGAL